MATVPDTDFARCAHDRSIAVRELVFTLRILKHILEENAEFVLRVKDIKSVFFGLRILREIRVVGELSDLSKVFVKFAITLKHEESEERELEELASSPSLIQILVKDSHGLATTFKGHLGLCNLFVYMAEREGGMLTSSQTCDSSGIHVSSRADMLNSSIELMDMMKANTAHATLIAHIKVLSTELRHGVKAYKNEHEVEADAAYRDILTVDVCYWCLKSSPAYNCPSGCGILKYCNETCANLHAPHHTTSCRLSRLGLWDKVRTLLMNGEGKKLKKLLRLNSIC